MNNEELKKKITEIIGDVYLVNAPIKDVYKPIFMEKIADALIAAGIGDVSEYKEKLKLHRVFVRKDGGDVKVLYGNKEVDEIVKEREEYKHRAEVAERALDLCETAYILSLNHRATEGVSGQAIASDLWIHKFFMEQAEKELAEEAK